MVDKYDRTLFTSSNNQRGEATLLGYRHPVPPATKVRKQIVTGDPTEITNPTTRLHLKGI